MVWIWEPSMTICRSFSTPPWPSRIVLVWITMGRAGAWANETADARAQAQISSLSTTLRFIQPPRARFTIICVIQWQTRRVNGTLHLGQDGKGSAEPHHRAQDYFR